MKKLYTLICIFILLFVLSSCKSKKPFDIYNNLGDYHYVCKATIVRNGNMYYQTTDGWQKDSPYIRYLTGNGYFGNYKGYYDLYNSYEYVYNYTDNTWERYDLESLDTSGFNGWKDINNYIYLKDDKDNKPYGYYKLKTSIDTGQIEYSLVYVNKDKHLVVETKIIYSDYYVIEVTEYVETNIKDLVLNLPENYIDKRKVD